MLLWVLTSISFTVLWCFIDKVQVFEVIFLLSFTSSSEKWTVTFWRLQGVINGINKSLRNIASGVENKADELMISIYVFTTPKVYLPHYFFIFLKQDPFGEELNNFICSRLGTLLYIEIQK